MCVLLHEDLKSIYNESFNFVVYEVEVKELNHTKGNVFGIVKLLKFKGS